MLIYYAILIPVWILMGRCLCVCIRAMIASHKRDSEIRAHEKTRTSLIKMVGGK